MARYLIYTFILFLLAHGCGDGVKDGAKKWGEEQEISAIENCVLSGNSDDYCKCSVSILVTIFSYNEFIEFDREIRSGQRPPQTIISKMTEMGKRVKEECQR